MMRLIGAAVTIALVAQGALRPVSFQTASDPSPRALFAAVADFNGDGKMDLAIASAYYSEIFIRLGNGDGTFQPAVPYRVQTYPGSIAVGDFNGDGKPDLAVTDYGTDDNPGESVSILLGNGDGTFQSAVDYRVGYYAEFIAMGDFRGEGKLDLAIPSAITNTVAILLGNGDGTFQPQVDYPAGPGPSFIGVGDFNGDGKADLVVTNSYAYAGTVSILLGNGDGSFQPPVAYAAGINPAAVAVGDFNGDGKPDLAVASAYYGSGTVILLGNGDGTFRQGATYADVGGTSIAAADFNGDGELDFVVGAVTILLGRGDGTFRPQAVLDNRVANSVATGDFDGDGKPDLALTNTEYGNLLVLLNTTP